MCVTLEAKPRTGSGASSPHPATAAVSAAPGAPGSNGRRRVRAGVASQRLPGPRPGGWTSQRSQPIAANPATNEPRTNDRIRAREVRLVGPDGTQLGIRPLPDALAIARDHDLDLVEVAPQATPPVCRIMDYGKWKFDAAQKARESRRKSTQQAIKEMKYRVKIGSGDFDTKTRKVHEFLEEGHKVKLTIMFRGREVNHPHLGKDILDRVADRVSDIAKVESAPSLDGRNMVMVLAPDRRAAQQAKAAKAADDGSPNDTSQES